MLHGCQCHHQQQILSSDLACLEKMVLLSGVELFCLCSLVLYFSTSLKLSSSLGFIDISDAYLQLESVLSANFAAEVHFVEH